MTPLQKIKWALLVKCEYVGEPITEDNVDEIYDEGDDGEETVVGLYDARYEFRQGEVETGLPCESSRHYESYSVAAKMPDGSWVGWTYWFGGGKYGEPEAVDWMGEAYDLTCVEEEKLVVVQTFTKVDA